MSSPKELLRVSVDNGKYTFILNDDDYRIKVLRYDQEWITIETGSKAIHCLMSELEQAREIGKELLADSMRLAGRLQTDSDL